MYFDIHSHIIPGIDDGAANLEQSKQLLRMMKARGADAVAATPHFYAESVNFESHSARAKQGFDAIKPLAEAIGLTVIKGYEVRYFHGIGRSDILKSLTLGGSDYLLLEFRYGEDITDRVISDVSDIYYNYSITPILAHIERYRKYRGFEKALELIDDGIALSHVNTSSFTDSYKKAAFSLINDNRVHFIASDAHNTETRQPLYTVAFEKLASHFGDDCVEQFKYNSEQLFDEIAGKRV